MKQVPCIASKNLLEGQSKINNFINKIEALDLVKYLERSETLQRKNLVTDLL